MSGRSLEVLATGVQALVQDLGRQGYAAVGVGCSGAADRGALRLGNRLLANPEDAAAIEAVLGGLVLRAVGDVVVAVTGAPAGLEVDGTPAAHCSVVPVESGPVLRLRPPVVGLRSYLAVRGGVDVPPVLGSRSTDTLSGIGPDPLSPGVVLPVGAAPTSFPVADAAPPHLGDGASVLLRAVPGPRAEWVRDVGVLATTRWAASSRSDRIGMRLEGPRLEPAPRSAGAELPSEAVVRGAVQVPPSGQPVLFLADHPVTGGYPVVAVVLDADVDRAAQVRPGQPVRFVLVAAP